MGPRSLGRAALFWAFSVEAHLSSEGQGVVSWMEGQELSITKKNRNIK